MTTPTTPDGETPLTVDPTHESVDEPGGEQAPGEEVVPGLSPGGAPDLPVPDDPGTGGPGEEDGDDADADAP